MIRASHSDNVATFSFEEVPRISRQTLRHTNVVILIADRLSGSGAVVIRCALNTFAGVTTLEVAKGELAFPVGPTLDTGPFQTVANLRPAEVGVAVTTVRRTE